MSIQVISWVFSKGAMVVEVKDLNVTQQLAQVEMRAYSNAIICTRVHIPNMHVRLRQSCHHDREPINHRLATR